MLHVRLSDEFGGTVLQIQAKSRISAKIEIAFQQQQKSVRQQKKMSEKKSVAGIVHEMGTIVDDRTGSHLKHDLA